MPEATQVGLKNLYYSILSSDTVGVSAIYATPLPIAPVIMAKVKPKATSAVLYADNGAAEAATAVGETDLELETKNIPIAIQAILLGHTLSGGVMTRKTTDIAPYVAIGFEALKSNGTKRYVWLFKGRFLVPEDDFKTKGDKAEFQTAKIKGIFVKRDFDDAYSKTADEEDAGYLAAVGTAWYTTVEGAADTTPPTITGIVPLAAAVGVVATTTVAWTFDLAIQWTSALAAQANFGLFADVTGVAVAGALSINALKTIVTFTPTSSLAATTAYRTFAGVGIKDIAGNALAADSITKFTTA